MIAHRTHGSAMLPGRSLPRVRRMKRQNSSISATHSVLGRALPGATRVLYVLSYARDVS
jgi:hypothetical protein